MFDKITEIDFYSSEVLKSYNLDDKIKYQLSMLDGLDSYTRRHSENVANLTCRLCYEMGLDEGFTIYTTTCAYLHDIGKTFIPPKVLQKNGKLTDEEFEIMKSHTIIGYKMCMADLKLRPYMAGPYYHHESLDGTGYPRGLTAEDIPYEGQIIRVADEFDAISSKRQYKSHVGVTETVEILVMNSKPTKNSKRPKGYLRTPGKVDRKLVRALIKLIIEDTEMELYHKQKYIEYLSDERQRYYSAYSQYEKMLNAKTEDKKEYHKIYALGYLTRHEELENVASYIEDADKTLEEVKKSEKKLKKEIKILKRQRRRV